jgi:hypothetical protein
VALAEALKEHHWDKGPVGLVTISLARNNGKLRTKGFRDAMKENGGIQEVALDQMQRYTADETFKYVQDTLSAHPDLHGIFVQTDTPTLGAVRAIQAAHRESTVLLAALDGVPEFVDLIRQGKVVASGMRQPYLMGVRSEQALLEHLDGKTPPTEVRVPIIVVAKKNLDAVLPTWMAEHLSSEVDDDVALGPATADQHVALRRCIDRFGLVAHCPKDKPGLAGVADPGAACPPDRDVARFRKLEHAPERRSPADIETAAGE